MRLRVRTLGQIVSHDDIPLAFALLLGIFSTAVLRSRSSSRLSKYRSTCFPCPCKFPTANICTTKWPKPRRRACMQNSCREPDVSKKHILKMYRRWYRLIGFASSRYACSLGVRRYTQKRALSVIKISSSREDEDEDTSSSPAQKRSWKRARSSTAISSSSKNKE